MNARQKLLQTAKSLRGQRNTVIDDVNWLAVLSAGAFGFVTAMLLALTGLPEVE